MQRLEDFFYLPVLSMSEKDFLSVAIFFGEPSTTRSKTLRCQARTGGRRSLTAGQDGNLLTTKNAEFSAVSHLFSLYYTNDE